MSTRESVILKWGTPNAVRVIESDEELSILGDIVSEKLEAAKVRLDELTELFDTDVDQILENMVNTDQSIEAFAMLSIHENEDIQETIVKRVNALGVISRVKDRETRKRLATQTTGLSKSTRRQIARKAAKTKRAKPSIARKATRKRRKAMKKRAALGL